MSYTILMILNQQFLPDPRVEQEYAALKKEGYRVIVVASNRGFDSTNYEILRVTNEDGLDVRNNLTLRSNRKLSKRIVKKLRDIGVSEIDAIHVHDLFWSFLGFQLKCIYNAKLVIDLHENYPAMKEAVGAFPKLRTLWEYLQIGYWSLRSPKNGPIWQLIAEVAHRPSRLRRYEKRILDKCDRFIVVVDEALERFKGLDFYKKGIVVSNTKDPALWRYDSVNKVTDTLIITYMGTIQDLRGLDTAIVAMKYLDQCKFQLNIVGVKPGSLMQAKFIKLIEENRIGNVNLVEWLDDEQEAFKYMNDSHVCIVPHKNTDLTQTTIPHKLFMYMAIGRPVLVSDVAPLKRIVEASDNGMIFEAENPRDLADKLQLMNNAELLGRFSEHGRRAVEKQFNWEFDKFRLIEMYKELLEKE